MCFLGIYQTVVSVIDYFHLQRSIKCHHGNLVLWTCFFFFFTCTMLLPCFFGLPHIVVYYFLISSVKNYHGALMVLKSHYCIFLHTHHSITMFFLGIYHLVINYVCRFLISSVKKLSHNCLRMVLLWCFGYLL